jgi:hypothetical protein
MVNNGAGAQIAPGVPPPDPVGDTSLRLAEATP